MASSNAARVIRADVRGHWQRLPIRSHSALPNRSPTMGIRDQSATIARWGTTCWNGRRSWLRSRGRRAGRSGLRLNRPGARRRRHRQDQPGPVTSGRPGSRARVLAGGREDLLTPRDPGAAAGRRPRARAKARSPTPCVRRRPGPRVRGRLAELAALRPDAPGGRGRPLGRRRDPRRAPTSGSSDARPSGLLLLTYRDDDWSSTIRCASCSAGMGGAAVRLPLAPPDGRAVTALAGGAEVDTADLFGSPAATRSSSQRRWPPAPDGVHRRCRRGARAGGGS